MFVALRDLRFARGRFVLIGAVVGLITVLVGFLSGLTGGLANQNISAVLDLPGDRVVFSTPSNDQEESPTFADSRITEDQAAGWATTDGVSSAQPIGISQTSAESGDNRAAIAVFGVQPGFEPASPSGDGLLSLSETAADDLDVTVGAEVDIAGTTYTVEKIDGDRWYSHTTVVQMTLGDWQSYSDATGNPDTFATVLAVTGSPDWEAADTAQATVSEGTLGSLMALSAFKSEIGSLLLMVAMLFGISGLVIGAFFTVWTMQRKGDVAVLKALGASTRSLVRDALGQALVVLVIGIGIGLGIVVLLGLLLGSALPFILSPLTTLLPAAIMIALGLAGAAFALRSVTSADPLTALGSNR
ncbi:ABC transporter permease [Arthrobacter echini]|uniref:ABC transporter permease n=1 Tax=Arthrobacter echini TaxID=1529066 RepID=A0A5D0XQS4_9MICC|nr:ABC transporter permease [Arthrobacter echini]TYC98838.1 ABC transporter permease [Arthrobacter echini]